MPDTDEQAYRGLAEAWTFRLRLPLLALYTVVALAVAWAGSREDSDLAILTVPSFAFACLVGYLSPAVSPLLPLVAFAGGVVEASGINLIGGLLVAEFCVILGGWNRHRRQRAVEDWRERNNS